MFRISVSLTKSAQLMFRVPALAGLNVDLIENPTKAGTLSVIWRKHTYLHKCIIMTLSE
jgi:hypothetical protein